MRFISELQANVISRGANAVAEHAAVMGCNYRPFAQRFPAIITLERERGSDKRDCHLQSPYATTTKGLNA